MNDIDEVKSRLNIVDIVGARVVLKKAGRNFKGLCPFHNEKTPSFMVSPDRQTFHCFGCGKGGSAIDFVMEYEHIDFVEALEQLAEKVGVTLTRRTGDSPEQKLKERIYEANELASELYAYFLTKHKIGEKALLYLKNRGVTDKAIVTFGIGYSPNSWDTLGAYMRKKGFDEATLIKAGLVLARDGKSGSYDRFRGRVMFTLRDHRGKAVGFSGRVLDPDVKEAKYINTSETPVYHKSDVLFGLDVTKDAISKANEAILMEGEMDVISSFQAGVGNVIAIKGTALTEAHVRLLKRFTDRLIFSLDSDMAGDAAARRGIDIAEKAGMDMKVVVMPSGKDPDEAARENPVEFKKAIKQAVPIYDYFLSSVAKRHDLTSAYGKRKAGDELLPILSRISNPIIQGHYVKKLATMLEVPEETVAQGVRMVKPPLSDGYKPPVKTEEETKLSGDDKRELYLLALVLQGKTQNFTAELFSVLQPPDFRYDPVARILENLKTYSSSHPAFDIREFASSIPNELTAVLDEAYLWDLSTVIEDDILLVREWAKVLRDVRRSLIKRQIRELTRSLEIEAEGGEPAASGAEDIQKRLSAFMVQLKALEKSE